MSTLKKKLSRDCSIYAEVHGHESAPGILFLHGFLGSSQDWSEFMNTFYPDFFCVALDFPGHGQSLEDDEEIYAMPNLAVYIIKLLQKWPAKKWAVIGYSMGGRLALYLALHYSAIFTKAVVISASPGLQEENERFEREQKDELQIQALLQSPMSEFLKHWYQQPLFSSLKSKLGFEEMWQHRLRNDPIYLAKSIRCMGLAKQPSLWQMLGDCLVPLLFVCGVLDEKFLELNQKMCRLCPQAKLSVIANCGHNVVVEAPENLKQILRSFL